MPRRVRAVGAKARKTTTALRARIGKSNKTISRRAGRLGLFPAVGSALGAGLAVAVAAYGFLHRIVPASEAEAAPIDITRVSLTIVAGIGGVVALVIAYRRQRDIEQSRFVRRFGAAAGQLGATDVAVRIAGVYAMAGAADECDGLRRQQCIDVLCGYLRLPYDPGHGSSGRTKLVTTIPDVDGGETEEHIEYRQNDREVRRTIVRVIADRLQPEVEYCWSTSNFDFRGAQLEETTFTAATFSGLTWFDQATFNDTAGFDKATFNGPVGFDGATFNGPAAFDDAAFNGRARFSEITFNDSAAFQGTTFNGDAGFYRATFNGHAGFEGATFNDAGFYRATFNGHARFDNATFNGDIVFRGATFNGRAEFQEATFNDVAGFGKATFNGHAGFQEVTFNGDARFAEATFNGPTGFSRVTFTSPATFANTDFGSERVVFDGPLRWGPPAPEFDWDQNVAERPANVEPQNWPPAPVSA
ncbi:pentapeptide repeat-containing protein [Nocardia sp. 2YAB30]|uniref:pentapeptide repeat-containing protein n=1 Tax=unclassified Nocardia TaxID=2637762 RepID=UPI003F9C17E5